MLKYDPLQLPSEEELPCSDDTPVDNELQNLIPNLLGAILAFIWQDRRNWFFAVDMGIYHTTGTNPRIPIVPDGFLSLGVERLKGDKLRLSYIVWKENNVVPVWVLEIVSHTYGGEYGNKAAQYAQLGVLYYAIYNPEYSQRDRHDLLEVYRLVDGAYVRQPGEPVWMPEIGLGIGREQGTYWGITREWLYWYDQDGRKYPSPEEARQVAEQQAQQEAQRRQIAEQRAEQLAAQLRALGIEPDEA
ncbi:Uma2 family endonuclease [Trichocoleus sp. FACHB-90]|uniref:Uma2 family endonuclease n=1 Tax=Cyanophyceae TaxID=3028117 RepID=UPI001684D6C7|nr:Uma2 family endonuclease [Trichocoleus sp. FACHB-90]MBD1924787.1 Uma2 family endonuclease [Trichocoleus sp. FACHB-90]